MLVYTVNKQTHAARPARLANGVPSSAFEVRGVTSFSGLIEMIDAALGAEPRLAGCVREQHGEVCVWARSDVAVMLSPSGSTGILVEFVNGGSVLHRKVFAASAMSVGRIATTSTEHLTGYARP